MLFYVRVGTRSSCAPRRAAGRLSTARLEDDGNGWTIVTTPAPGLYVFDGDFTRPLR